MSDTIIRKKNTGEPGNGGHFGHQVHALDDVTLPAGTQDGPTREHKTLAAEHAAAFPGTQGENPNYWWRRDRAKTLLAQEEPLEFSDAEHLGWTSVDRNIVPMVNEWLTVQPLSWIAFQVGRQEEASRHQVDVVQGLTNQAAWEARANRLKDIADGINALYEEEIEEHRAAHPMPPTPTADNTASVSNLASPTVTPTTETPVFPEQNRRRRGQKFFVAEMKKWPKLYSNEDTPLEDVPIVGHFCAASFDFWAAEYDPQTGQAWGYTRINGLGPGEWGYQDLREIEKQLIGPLRQPIERETYWSKTAWKDVDGN